MRILFVDDDERLAGLVRRALSEAGHVVDCAPTGSAGMEFAAERSYDAIVLDVMMPEIDGFTVVRRLRERGLTTPVLFLTARDAPEDTIAGLDAGADDYLRKPFVFGELEARLRSIARRTAPPRDPVLAVADLTFDVRTRRARRGTREIDLRARERVSRIFYASPRPGLDACDDRRRALDGRQSECLERRRRVRTPPARQTGGRR
jgi:DNA-binding response OmpR family regulator